MLLVTKLLKMTKIKPRWIFWKGQGYTSYFKKGYVGLTQKLNFQSSERRGDVSKLHPQSWVGGVKTRVPGETELVLMIKASSPSETIVVTP